MTEYIEYPAKKPIHLENENCPYCGTDLDSTVPTNEEHAVGRRFVPKGQMANQLNLIFRTCVACNTEKAQLEDDISVISMIKGRVSRGDEIEAVLASEVKRKAEKSGSKRTGRSVARSQEHVAVKGSFGPATFTFGFVAPPQIDHERVYKLAQLHFDAFFFEATFDRATNRGGFFPAKAHHNVGYFPRSDWGADKATWFMNETREWPLTVVAVTANGYFRLIIRQSPSKDVYACAVEWNHSIRVMRLLGNPDAIKALIESAPEPAGAWVKDKGDNPTRVKQERELAPDDDTLFVVTMPAAD